MNNLSRLTSILFFVIISLLVTHVWAAAPNGVDQLRGRWSGIAEDHLGKNFFDLALDDFGTDPKDPKAYLYNGCITSGDIAEWAPVSAQAIASGSDKYSIILNGTMKGSVIKMTGTITLNSSSVTDDLADGSWQNNNSTGTWTATHHDRSNPHCPAVVIGNNLSFMADVHAFKQIHPDVNSTLTIGSSFQGYTNIVSSGMQVKFPNGHIEVMPFYTDIFSPGVDFINQFRFNNWFNGPPVSGKPYLFSLLDSLGQPIPGTEQEDTWIECSANYPHNISASLSPDGKGIMVSWTPVTDASGFQPWAHPQIGFYQIRVNNESGSTVFGSIWIGETQHFIPYNFNPTFAGYPDGTDLGPSLSELPIGKYSIIVETDTLNTLGSRPNNLECTFASYKDVVLFTKTDTDITIINP